MNSLVKGKGKATRKLAGWGHNRKDPQEARGILKTSFLAHGHVICSQFETGIHDVFSAVLLNTSSDDRGCLLLLRDCLAALRAPALLTA